MALAGNVIVKLEIEGMKHAILHAFQQYNTQIEDVVEDEVARAVEQFDFAAVVEHTIRTELPAALTRAVNQAIQQTVWTNEVQAAIKSSITNTLAKELDGQS